MTFEWKLLLRDSNYQIQGEIDDYQEATLTPIYNDVGTWSLKLDRRSRLASSLVEPNWGIVAARNDVPLFSGIVNEQRHVVSRDEGTITFTGFTDEVWLQDRLVSPSPAEAGPPYDAQASDVREGVASTVVQGYVNVNLGPGAVVARRKSNLTVATDPMVGGSVKGDGRWDNLLTFIQTLALSGEIGFRVVQVGAGLQFQTYIGDDRSGTVKFSVDLGNLAGYEYSRTRPRSNFAYVGASGTGTSRILKEYPDSDALAAWERIEGPLVNQSETADAATLDTAGSGALAQNSEQVSLSITPLETADLMYGVHYVLGDKVTVQMDGPSVTPYAEVGQVVDILRQVEIRLTPNGPQTVTPTMGTPSRGMISKLIRSFQQQTKRITYLERQ